MPLNECVIWLNDPSTLTNLALVTKTRDGGVTNWARFSDPEVDECISSIAIRATGRDARRPTRRIQEKAAEVGLDRQPDPGRPHDRGEPQDHRCHLFAQDPYARYALPAAEIGRGETRLFRSRPPRTQARPRGLRRQPAQGALARRRAHRDLAGRQLRGRLGAGDRRWRCDREPSGPPSWPITSATSRAKVTFEYGSRCGYWRLLESSTSRSEVHFLRLCRRSGAQP